MKHRKNTGYIQFHHAGVFFRIISYQRRELYRDQAVSLLQSGAVMLCLPPVHFVEVN